MATLGGKFLLDQPLQVKGNIISIGNESTVVDLSSSKAVVVGADSSVGAGSAGSIVIGGGSTVGTVAPNNLVLGQSSSVPNNKSFNIVLGNTCTSSGIASVVAGFHSSTSANGTISIGTFATIAAGSDASVAVGNVTVDVNSPYCVGVGQNIQIHSPQAISIGYQSGVGLNSTGSIALGAGSTIGNSNSSTSAIGNAVIVGNGPGTRCAALGTNISFAGGTDVLALGSNLTLAGPGLTSLVVIGAGNTATAFNTSTIIGTAITVNGGAGSGYDVVIGNNNTVGDTTLSTVIGAFNIVPDNVGSVIILSSGTTIAPGHGALGGVMIGGGATITSNAAYAIAIGSAASAGDNQCVIGNSNPAQSAIAMHQFIVRGLTAAAAAIDTINVIDNPAPGSTGLTIVYNAAGTFTNKTIKAAASPPGPSPLLLYVDS
jgi:hypothetical protein